jgi:hypothetical protein
LHYLSVKLPGLQATKEPFWHPFSHIRKSKYRIQYSDVRLYQNLNLVKVCQAMGIPPPRSRPRQVWMPIPFQLDVRARNDSRWTHSLIYTLLCHGFEDGASSACYTRLAKWGVRSFFKRMLVPSYTVQLLEVHRQILPRLQLAERAIVTLCYGGNFELPGMQHSNAHVVLTTPIPLAMSAPFYFHAPLSSVSGH